MNDCLKDLICPCCKAAVSDKKFCDACGSPLNRAERAKETGAGNMQDSADFRASDPPLKQTQQPKALSDAGLTLLVDACKKTIATVGGDGYSEIVLYLDERTGEFWLHTYSKYENMPEEAHASYAASPELTEKVLACIEEKDLASWKDNKGFPFCGGDVILRFKRGDELIRLDSGKMPDGLKAYSDISSMLYAGVNEENRRYADFNEQIV